MATRMMVVHTTRIAPDLHGAGPEDKDPQAEKPAVCFLLASALACHHSLRLLVTIGASDIGRRSFVDDEPVLGSIRTSNVFRLIRRPC